MYISTLRALRHFGNNEDISFSFRAAGIHELKRASEVTMGPESRAQADRSIIMNQVRRQLLSTQLNAVHHVVVRFVL